MGGVDKAFRPLRKKIYEKLLIAFLYDLMIPAKYEVRMNEI